MNKLIFLARFNEENLEFINDRIQKSIDPEEIIACELNEEVLKIEFADTGITFLTIIEDGLRIESDDFFDTLFVAEIIAEYFEEDQTKRAMFINP
jgi:hypothetical protein